MIVANRKASLLTNKALPTSKARTLNAMTLSMPIFIIMAAIIGPIFLFLPRPVKIAQNQYGHDNYQNKIIYNFIIYKYFIIGSTYYLTKLIENVLIVSICMETSDIYYNILCLQSTYMNIEYIIFYYLILILIFKLDGQSSLCTRSNTI